MYSHVYLLYYAGKAEQSHGLPHVHTVLQESPMDFHIHIHGLLYVRITTHFHLISLSYVVL